LLIYGLWWVIAGITAMACGLSLAGGVRSRGRWGVALSVVIGVLAGMYACVLVVLLVLAGPLTGLVYCEANLRDIASASQIGFMEAGRVPRDISDLVVKEVTDKLPDGMLSPNMVICPYDWRRQRHPEEAGSSYFLAPLDKVFFDEKFLQDNPGVTLCSYCTVVHSRWRPARTYVTTDGHAGITLGEELTTWVSVQAEAVTWLEDEFPMDELERFAQSTERHRRELASAILRYRVDRARR
jgi:hypothetical protein